MRYKIATALLLACAWPFLGRAQPQMDAAADVRGFGAVCDGNPHPLSEVALFKGKNTSGWTLGQWHAVFPAAVALSQEIDDAATQLAADTLSLVRIPQTVNLPVGVCLFDYTIFARSGARFAVSGRGSTLIVKTGDHGPVIQFGADSIAGSAPSITSSVGITDLGFIRTSIATGQTINNASFIRFVGVSNAWVSHVSMINTFEGIDIQGGAGIAIDDITASAAWNTTGTVISNVSTKGANFQLHTEYGHQSADGTGGVANRLPTWVRISDWTTASAATLSPYVPLGPTYGFWITACESCVITRAYVGHTQIAGLMIEQGRNDAPILDNDYTSDYFDASATQSVGIFPHGVPASMTHDGVARAGGSGAVTINDQRFTGGTINGSTIGARGLYVDGTLANSGHPIGVTSLSIQGTQFSGHLGYGLDIEQGINTLLSGVQVKGNNYANSTGGGGILLGPHTQKTNILNSVIGGDAIGLNSTVAYQVSGISVTSGTSGLVIKDTDLSGNLSPFIGLPADTQVSGVTAGTPTVVYAPAEGASIQLAGIPQQIILAPATARHAITIVLPTVPFEGETIHFRVTTNTIGALKFVVTKGGVTIVNGVARNVAAGAVFTIRYIGDTWAPWS